jgi:hypothetical protein
MRKLKDLWKFICEAANVYALWNAISDANIWWAVGGTLMAGSALLLQEVRDAPILAYIFIGIGVCCTILLIVQGLLPKVKVYRLFRAVHATQAAKLGKPLAAGVRVKSDEIYQAVHEHATVIWLRSQMRIYRLAIKDETWSSKVDPDWDTDKSAYNDADIKRRFGFEPPEGLGPPHGGVAVRWFANPQDWKWMGWRKWHCQLLDDSEGLPAYQIFEGGIMIGGLLAALSESSVAQVFILLNDSRWSSVEMTGVKPPGFKLLPEQ